MSIYDERNTPAYRDVYRVYHDSFLNQWWTAAHDQLIADLIEEHQWNWYWEFPDSIKKVTPEYLVNILESQRNWRNKALYHARTRAHETGLIRRIRKSEQKECPLCGNIFQEDSLPHPLVKRLGGPKHLDFCAPCLKVCLLRGFYLAPEKKVKDKSTKKEIIDFLNRLTVVLERVPAQNVGQGMFDLIDVSFDKRLDLLRILKNRPSEDRVKEVFGSWLKALIEAGILVDGTRETSRGTQTIALDGHTCLSLGEKTIDDFLYTRGIAHKKEPRYPDSNFRADFQVGDVFIEYFGLAGDAAYDVRIKEKIRLCEMHGIKLVTLYPKDLIATTKLEKRLSEFL